MNNNMINKMLGNRVVVDKYSKNKTKYEKQLSKQYDIHSSNHIMLGMGIKMTDDPVETQDMIDEWDGEYNKMKKFSTKLDNIKNAKKENNSQKPVNFNMLFK